MFDHVQIKVKNFRKSRPFYDAIFSILKYKVVFEYEEEVVGYGTNPHNMFEIRQASTTIPVSKSTHIAFVAKNKRMVDDFYKTALMHGAKSKGKPGPRPDYEPDYYAAFVIDPNGHNLEAVFKKP